MAEEKEKEVKPKAPDPIHKIHSWVPWDHVFIEKINPDTGESLDQPIEGIVTQRIRLNECVSMVQGGGVGGIPRFKTSPVQNIYIMSDGSYWVQTGRSTYRVTPVGDGILPSSSSSSTLPKETAPQKSVQWTLAALLKLLGLKS
ncbi:MAG TPA: hypothetical protein VI873_03960 [Candidatus Peribacteraceae bacterium]|nr:hypothetical protein [Candidatus Peribacteraceae bacterium]